MISRHSRLTGRVVSAVSALIWFTAHAGSATDPPKPTPRPGTLGAYAEGLTLDRAALGDGEGRVIITNDGIVALAADGSITLGSVPTTGRPKAKGVAGSAERYRWRAAHRKQSRVITEIVRRRALLEIAIENVEDGRLTIRTMARLQQMEAKLRQLDREIAAERAELARIVREARRHGAEPGWFR